MSKLHLIWCLVPTLWTSPVGTPAGLSPNDQVARGTRCAVVSADSHATTVGLQVLRSGGNAVDAAVAVALTLSVTHPQAGNLGGGGFMVIRLSDGRTTSLDFRELAPARATRDMYLREDGSVHPDKSLWGALAGGVPGSPAGLLAVHQKFGKQSFASLVAPAIRLAREGFEVDQFLAAALAAKHPILSRFPATKAVFYRGDRPLKQGERLVQRDLADTLERLAKGGFDGFYRGVTAEHFVTHLRAQGGIIQKSDLAAYQPVWRTPVQGSYRGHTVLSMPPVSSGGIALIEMLNILEGFDLRASGFGSSKTVHLMAESMKRAYADRARWLGDPGFYKVPQSGLVAKAYAARYRKSIRLDKVTKVTHGVPKGAKESDDTTHFSVVDAAGNAVSCTTTINSIFGSGMVAGRTGFLLNNEMDDFSAKPGTPNQFGLVGGEANAIAAGKRMLSSMTPTIVLKDGKLRLVLGSPGGGRIINTVLQVILNVVDHGLPVDQAVRAPRVHHQWRPDHLFWEPTSLSADVRAGLHRRGHAFAAAPIVIGRCQAIEILPDGTRFAAADPRSGGSAAAF
ncbi:MAG: gamma-glutamyltransferase [Planctomycetota bacterium]|nr:gamma-glutamyltransferase [Planctomycetota bacterium]